MECFFDAYVGNRMHHVIKELATALHAHWKRNIEKDYLAKNQPADTARPRNQPGFPPVNINVPYGDLSPEWQLDNDRAAAIAFDVALKTFGDADVDEGAKAIHVEWMLRNPINDANSYNHIPYADLPDNEKAKDRVHVILAREHVASFVRELYQVFPTCTHVMSLLRVAFEISRPWTNVMCGCADATSMKT